MIIIVDDTFRERYKYHNIDYLKDKKYSQVCTVKDIVKTTELLSIIEKDLLNCQLFCYHKTLQLFDMASDALNNEDNLKNRESLIDKVTAAKINKIEFSRGLETKYIDKKIDKDLFYTNLKAFLDFFIETKIVETKILFWGENFEDRERIQIFQNLMAQIRINKFEDYKNSPIISSGLEVLFPGIPSEQIIDDWSKRGLSINEIITEINNKVV